jgi:nucleotidyltransferase substrate binding protein (TIGR01987 family)
MTEALQFQLDKFKNSLKRLNEALERDKDKDDLVLNAVIQRFEFTFENSWKSIKQTLRIKGIDCLTPRDCIKESFRNGWLKNEEIFLELLECRNLTSHTYRFETAVRVYDSVKKNAFVFDELLSELENNLDS